MLKYLFLVLLISLNAQAKEGWFCERETSAMSGGDLKTCGTATADTAEKARSRALYYAHHEFYDLCQISDTCRGYPISIMPGRVVCEEHKHKEFGFDKSEWTCTRMVTFTIDRDKRQCKTDCPSTWPSWPG